MRNSPRRFVIALTVLASLILFVGSLVLSEHAKAQNPKPTTPADTSKDKQTCEGIKNQLKSLIESVEALTKELDRLRAELDKLDQSLQKYQEYVADNPIKVWLGDHLGTTNSQATINKLNAAKEKLQNEIKLDEEVLPDIKKSIQEILDKIGPCDNKTTPTTKPPTPPVKSTTPVITLNGVPGEPEDCAEFRRNYNFQKNALSQTNLSPQDRERFEKALENSRRGYCQCLIKNHISPLPEICQDITNPQSTSSPTLQPSPTPAQNTNNQVGYHVDSKTGNGLVVTTFDTPQGKIKVNLPDDMAAGDTITGTVEVEPNGKNDAERTQNEGELNGYVIEVGGQKTKVSDKKINCIIPTTLTSDAKTIVLTRNNQRVATSECPISQTPPATPAQTTLPTGGQQGRTIECQGNFSPTDQVSIGGTVMPAVASSPRKIVVRNTCQTMGPTTIKVGQQECPFRNIGIKLSAPKLNLQRGETTTLHVLVSGLAGITQPVTGNVVNNTPNVIKMAGGEVRHLTIQLGQVQADGTYSLDITLTGIMPGGFGITGTVNWDEACKLPGQ